MGIFERINGIVKSNINDLLDKAEDPAKMCEQTLIDLRKDLAEVKKNVVAVMAEEERCRDEYEEAKTKVAQFEEAAKKYLVAGDEEKAKKCLTRKAETEQNLVTLEANYNSIKERADSARKSHDELVETIRQWEGKAAAIKSTVSVAKTQQNVNKAMSRASSSNAVHSMDRMEKKANKMLREADAMAKLNSSAKEESDDDLLAGSGVASSDVDAELAKLKASMGM